MTVYADLVRYRELFANLFRRDFHAKYKGSALGVAWSLVNPLALLGVYLVVFGLLIKSGEIPHYPLYLLSGLACWIFFAVSLQTAARSMVDSAELIRKVRFPRQLVAFSVVATQAVTFAVMLAILIVLSLIFIPDAAGTVWLAIPLALLFVALVAGLALLVACLNVLFRDVEHILDGGAPAVVLPDADPLDLLDAAGDGEVAPGAAGPAAVGKLRRPTDRRGARRALVGASPTPRRRRLPGRGAPSSRSSSGRSSSAHRRPHRDRALNPESDTSQTRV